MKKLKGIQEERERILKIIEDKKSWKIDGLKNSIPYLIKEIEGRLKNENE